jgi:hypothetical protein
MGLFAGQSEGTPGGRVVVVVRGMVVVAVGLGAAVVEGVGATVGFVVGVDGVAVGESTVGAGAELADASGITIRS